ncbi:hypothetical protein BC938DRAFT_481288 [Jimgerdemannia flammicorona]|uniref:Uncharacterized protein n=1 Tax=Jimgerdemannia flammicorona TaxID=994334 RepID=A0A433QH55_9FUNG|nr:hypothetical protein BC938DRAFT_481288 [Jimgerdemannia flammicorona]
MGGGETRGIGHHRSNRETNNWNIFLQRHHNLQPGHLIIVSVHDSALPLPQSPLHMSSHQSPLQQQQQPSLPFLYALASAVPLARFQDH